MFRIALPLLLAAALVFGPLYTTTTEDSYAGEMTASKTASELYFSGAVDCAKNMKFDPRAEGCGHTEGTGALGMAFYATAASSVLAGVLGIVGLLPFIGRLTSIVATGAGGIGTGTLGYFLLDIMNNQAASFANIGWGGWAAGAFAVLTLIAGFTGMSGNND